MAKKRLNAKGYTLIEMMIVIAIMGILATIALPNMQRSITRAREVSLRNTLFELRDMIDQFYADHGKYPEALEELVDRRYLRSVPQDPITGATDTWITIPPEGEERGQVFDVHSGSDRVSLEGTPYNEW